MGKFNEFLLGTLLAFIATATFKVEQTSADCRLSVSGDFPVISEKIGFFNVIHRPSARMQFNNEQKLHLYCHTSISASKDNTHLSDIKNELNLHCVRDNWQYEKGDYLPTQDQFGVRRRYQPISNFYNPASDLIVTCSPGSRSILYESKTNLPRCDLASTHTYVIAKPSTVESNPSADIGICFDWDAMTPIYAHFIAYSKNFKTTDEEEDSPLDKMTFDQELPELSSTLPFMSEEAFNRSLVSLQEIHSVLKPHNFDWDYLLQDAQLQERISGARKLLNIVWWQNLRLGNWRLFLKALQERTSEGIKYVVHTGISQSMIHIPKRNVCDGNKTLKFGDEEASVSAPEYIWAYLRSIDIADSEEFVVIGYNSPFYNIGEQVSLCQDKCGEINWIARSELNYTRQMPTMGLIHCCDPKEVATKIQSFPWLSDAKPKEVVKVTEAVTDY